MPLSQEDNVSLLLGNFCMCDFTMCEYGAAEIVYANAFTLHFD